MNHAQFNKEQIAAFQSDGDEIDRLALKRENS